VFVGFEEETKEQNEVMNLEAREETFYTLDDYTRSGGNVNKGTGRSSFC
jgi:hypothetical protein